MWALHLTPMGCSGLPRLIGHRLGVPTQVGEGGEGWLRVRFNFLRISALHLTHTGRSALPWDMGRKVGIQFQVEEGEGG